jgi:3-hydroxybutyryl-CoA dehydrogenase
MKVILITENADRGLFPGVGHVVVRTVAEAVEHRDADLYVDLDFDGEAARVSALSGLLPSLVMVNAVAITIAEIGQPFIRINGWAGIHPREIHELVVPAELLQGLEALYAGLGRSFRLAPDIPGMVTARILATIINEAWYTWQDGVSSKEEIDTAMKLGTNYPMGPFEWGGKIGLPRVVGLLDRLSRTDARYMPADSLKEAVSGIKI